MAFEAKKFNELFDSMRGRTTNLTDFEEGSVIRTVYEAFSFELGLLYEKMNLVYLSAFVDTATGSQLDNVVAILGIQRGLPDFAVGEVSFFRDKGNEDIAIPVGTLVATEDSPENPKKVYQTIDAVVLGENATTVSVKVQAIERGIEQNAATEAIAVMPRPIPGIKSVLNTKNVKLIGRQRETDIELRSRAKNALLSSGKANITSIENALLSQPGVLDVKVEEDFHYARGEITITISRAVDSEALIIPKGANLIAEIAPGFEYFRTLNDLNVAKGVTDGTDTLEIEAVLEGKMGEKGANIGLQFEDAKLNNDLTIDSNTEIKQLPYGVVKVFVDSNNYEEIKGNVRAKIEEVRAAGIFVELSNALKITIDGVFKIEINEQLNLDAAERIAFENEVKGAIEDYFLSLKMGETFHFSKMIRAILSVENVENLEDFNLLSTQEKTGNIANYAFSNQKITAEAAERFKARHICVASEIKTLPVDLNFKTTNPITPEIFDKLKSELTIYFNGLGVGGQLTKDNIETAITNISEITNVNDLKIMPVSWCPKPETTINPLATEFEVMFVEKPALGTLFVYDKELEISGALLLLLQENATATEKTDTISAVGTLIDNYLDELPLESTINFEDIFTAVRKLPLVSDLRFEAEDIELFSGTDFVNLRLNSDDLKIDLAPFEKPVLTSNFLIKAAIETVQIEFTDISIDVVHLPGVDPVTEQIKGQVIHAIHTFFAESLPGKDVIYDDIKNVIRNLSLDFEFNLTELAFQLPIGDLTETATLGAPRNFKILITQTIIIKPVIDSIITITTKEIDLGPPQS